MSNPSPGAPRKVAALRPRDAATLILLDRRSRAPKVLMGRRHEGHRFMPGKFVFPGGRIDRSDRLMPSATELRPDLAGLAIGQAQAAVERLDGRGRDERFRDRHRATSSSGRAAAARPAAALSTSERMSAMDSFAAASSGCLISPRSRLRRVNAASPQSTTRPVLARSTTSD